MDRPQQPRMVQAQFEYCDFPALLTQPEPGSVGSEPPPMSAGLKAAFEAWSAKMSSLFESESEIEDGQLAVLNSEGRELARTLADELGTHFRVEYFDEIQQDFRSVP